MKHLASGLIKARGLPRIFHRLLGALVCAARERQKQTHNICTYTHTQGKKEKRQIGRRVLIRAAGAEQRLGRGANAIKFHAHRAARCGA